jgi:hypothetical protein
VSNGGSFGRPRPTLIRLLVLSDRHGLSRRISHSACALARGTYFSVKPVSRECADASEFTLMRREGVRGELIIIAAIDSTGKRLGATAMPLELLFSAWSALHYPGLFTDALTNK